jgi:1-acyl-sn-glycerol-3-phosphate acyltransferase
MQALRSAIFNVLFYLNLVFFLVVFFWLLFCPRSWAMWGLRSWARTSVWLLRAICGTRLDVRGRGHIPPGAVLVAAKHQSLFETFALIPLLADPAMVLKRELMLIPLFGWFARKFRMIPVDRGAGTTALKRLIGRAKEAVRGGRQVVIFPEGTRRAPGAPPDYKPGAVALYLNLGVPCVPLALNSGIFWPRRRFMRYSGTIVMEFLPAIPAGEPRAVFSHRLEEALEGKTAELLAAAAKSGEVVDSRD